MTQIRNMPVPLGKNCLCTYNIWLSGRHGVDQAAIRDMGSGQVKAPMMDFQESHNS